MNKNYDNQLFICSDPDCSQYGLRLGETLFNFIEYRETHNEKFAVCSTTIDLADYTIEDIKEECSAFYDDFDEVLDYGREMPRIIAECIFENLDLGSLTIRKTFENEDDAADYINVYIQEYNNSKK